MSDFLLPGASKDERSITSDWTLVGQELIDGVVLREVKAVPKANGHLVEIYRSDWGTDEASVDQAFQLSLEPRQVSAWHAHESTIDRLFVNRGLMRIVLFDARKGSPTFERLNEFKLGEVRPGLVVIPPKVWHGIQNIGSGSATALNLVDRAYRYDAPDHWRIPSDSPDVPFRWH